MNLTPQGKINSEIFQLIDNMSENEKEALLAIAKKIHTGETFLNVGIPIGTRNISDVELFRKFRESKYKSKLLITTIVVFFTICLSVISFVLLINEDPNISVSVNTSYQFLIVAIITGMVGMLFFVYTFLSRRFVHGGLLSSSSKHKQLLLDAFMMWLNISVTTKKIYSSVLNETPLTPSRVIQALKDGQVINNKEQLALKNLLTINNDLATDDITFSDKEISWILKECNKVMKKLTHLQ